MLRILVVVHSCLILTSFSILTFIIYHLKKNAQRFENITTTIQTDLAIITGLFVNTFSAVVILREFHGLFQAIIYAELILLVLYSAFNAILYCILALQLAQAVFLLRPTTLIEGNLVLQAWVYRICVFVSAIGSGYYVSHQQVTDCSSSPICSYWIEAPPGKGGIKAQFYQTFHSCNL
jgi:hypothetical protein